MHRTSPRLQLSFEGSFELDDALRTASQLAGAVSGAHVSLDFARCARVDPAGLARLTGAITGQGGKVTLAGLSRHDLRILHYVLGPLDVTWAAEEQPD